MNRLFAAFLFTLAIAPFGAQAQGDLADAEWQKIQPLCEATTKGRYPFDGLSAVDVDMPAFANLFAPQGALDAFFAAHFAQLVDQTTSPWSIRQGVEAEGRLSTAALDMFQRAAEIRRAFFADGAETSVQMEIVIEAIDPKANSVALGIDGNLVTYSLNDGLPIPSRIVWPGEIGESFLIFTASGKTAEWRAEGAWAWPRLIDAFGLRHTDNPNRKRLVMEVEGLLTIFDVRTAALFPFGLSALDGFICPTTLQ